MKAWEELAYSQYKQNIPIKDIVKNVHTAHFKNEDYHTIYERVRSFIKRKRKESNVQNVHKCIQNDIESYAERTEYKADGSLTVDKLIEIHNANDLTPDRIMELHGLDKNKWKLISYCNNKWQQTPTANLYQSKVVVKPRINEIDFDAIDSYFKNKTFSKIKPLTTASLFDKDGETIEICLPDLHSGLLAWWRETGKSYDLKIAQEQFGLGMSDVMNRCIGRKIKKIYFVTLGDLLHIDNDENKTTKGTLQNTDGRISKIFDKTLDMLIDAITIFGNIAPTEVVYINGNHDRIIGYTLLKAVSKAFRNDDNIMFDTDPNPQKFRLIGLNLIGWTHGEMPQKNLGTWLQHEAKQAYGMSKYAEVHCGHLHTEGVKEVIQTENQQGVIVRRLPSICPSSLWEHSMGYPNSEKSVMTFVWDDNRGLRDTWYSNI